MKAKNKKVISIIIPAFNEEKTVLSIIDSVSKVNTLNYKKEIIVINDGSTDKTLKILYKNQEKFKYIVINNLVNKKHWLNAFIKPMLSKFIQLNLQYNF